MSGLHNAEDFAVSVMQPRSKWPERHLRGHQADEVFAVLAAGDEAASRGKGCHVAFRAPTREAVASFHAISLQHGAVDEGAPGERPAYGPGYYAAFVRDLDGHRIEAVCHEA